jgi:hypothetical protein
MNYTTFNIGLNNNPFNYEQLADFIDNAFNRTNRKVDIQLREGLYHPDEATIVFEPTAVVRVHHSHEYQDSIWAEMMSQTMCVTFTQECIPYRHIETKEGNVIITEELVYHPHFKGDKYEFDPAFFIDYDEEVN